MSISGDIPVNRQGGLIQFAQELSEQPGIDEVIACTRHAGANTYLFDNAINPPYRYLYPSVDLIARIGRETGRLFVHPTFPVELDEKGEAVLDQAGLGYFPKVAQGDRFSVRTLPLVTMPLLSHELGRTTGANISRDYLAPPITKLFKTSGLIPSRETMLNLARVEDLQQDQYANQRLDLGTRFVPPYSFEEVSEEEFVTRALANATDYGEHVVTNLEQVLAHA